MHVPVKEEKLIPRVYRLEVEKNLDLWYYSNKKSMTREHINPKELLDSKTSIMIQFHSAHYEGVILNNKSGHNLQWPDPMSHTIFEPIID